MIPAKNHRGPEENPCRQGGKHGTPGQENISRENVIKFAGISVARQPATA